MTLAVRYLRLLLRAFGVRGLARRAAYEARLRTGWLRYQLPVAPDFSAASPVLWHHRFDLDTIRARYADEGIDGLDRNQVITDAERVLSGQLQLYGDRWHDVGWPPRWHVNPFTGFGYPRVHWAEIPDDDPERGDIKDVWELSRWPFTFVFARAHVLTGEDRYVEAWWEAVEDWAAHNPPNTGVNWRCGQETSLRAIGLCFGLSAFSDHPASTPARRDLAARILGASVARVRPTVGYALSQRNNHAISEVIFLLSVKAPQERTWLRLLFEVLTDQFYEDGSYSQQSFTYQRLACETLQWLLVTRPGLPPGVRGRVVEALARSRDFLARCSDPVSGWLPNYGPNDGSRLFHLTNAHYRDFRPFLDSLQAYKERPYEPSLWIWLPEVASRNTDANARPTTYVTVRGPRSLALTRIGTGRHRPAHDDQQALDVWIDGKNVVGDPGTFRYTALPPWNNALASASVHSLPDVSGDDYIQIGRFMAEGMAPAELIHRKLSGEAEAIVTRRPAGTGWTWRAVLRRGDSFAIVDAAEGVNAVVRWNTLDPAEVDLCATPTNPEAVEARENAPESGWTSPLYGCREPGEVRLVHLPPGTVAVTCIRGEGAQPVKNAGMTHGLTGNLPEWALSRLSEARTVAGPSIGSAAINDERCDT